MEKSLFGSNEASQSQYRKNMDLAFNRFPELGLLNYETDQQSSFKEDRPISYAEIQQWGQTITLQSTEVIYVYGLGLGYAYFAFQPWLKKSPSHHLIFIEENLNAIKAFLHTSSAKKLLRDFQVHISPLLQEQSITKLSRLFPSENIKVLSLPRSRNKDRFQEIKEQLISQTILSAGTLAEQECSHRLFKNFLRNVSFLTDSFCVNELKNHLSGMPAVICGAGPSIEKQIKQLQLLQNKALIIAGGSSIAALTTNGVIPHIGVIIDPNKDEMERLAASFAFEIPIFYSTRVFRSVFAAFNGPLGYMRGNIGRSLEAWLEEKLHQTGDYIGKDMSSNALSVTSVCISLADYLGCNPIFLSGIDLAYTNKKRYASGVVQDSQSLNYSSKVLLQKKNQKGEIVDTNMQWIMESQSISDFAKKSKSRFINATNQGLGFHGMEVMSLEDALTQFFTQEYDLSNLLHSEMQNCSKFATKKDISAHLHSFRKSIYKVMQLTEKMIEELLAKKDFFSKEKRFFQTSQMVLAEMDLREEDAFIYLFQAVLPLCSWQEDSNLKDWEKQWESEKNKWESFLVRVKFHLQQMDYVPISI